MNAAPLAQGIVADSTIFFDRVPLALTTASQNWRVAPWARVIVAAPGARPLALIEIDVRPGTMPSRGITEILSGVGCPLGLGVGLASGDGLTGALPATVSEVLAWQDPSQHALTR